MLKCLRVSAVLIRSVAGVLPRSQARDLFVESSVMVWYALAEALEMSDLLSSWQLRRDRKGSLWGAWELFLIPRNMNHCSLHVM